jgi:hypothetical protein
MQNKECLETLPGDLPPPVGGFLSDGSSDSEDENAVQVTQCEVACAGREGDDLPEIVGGDDPQVTGVVRPVDFDFSTGVREVNTKNAPIIRRSDRVRTKPNRWGYLD